MARERWVYLKDGRLMMHEENDGWRYLHRGPEAADWAITLEEVRLQYPSHYEEARKLLEGQ
jgi:hypothetical protein